MTTEAQILALLTGQKVFDGRTWRVYGTGGGELADSGGVLWRGVHGALLWNVNQALSIALEKDTFNYRASILLGRYTQDPAMARFAQRMNLGRRR